MFPKFLKVGGHRVRIVLKPKWNDDAEGEWFPEICEIWINNKLPPSQLWATLIHEIFHVMNSEIDHVLLESFAQQFSQVLLDNKIIWTRTKNLKMKK